MKTRLTVCICVAAAFGALYAQNGNVLRCRSDTIYSVPPGKYFLLYGLAGGVMIDGSRTLYHNYNSLTLNPPIRFEAGTIFTAGNGVPATVYGYEGSLTGTVEPSGEAVERSILGAPVPDPWSGRAHLVYEVPKTAAVALRIVDVSGRTLATLQKGTMRPGLYGASWDGCNEAGELASAGTYFFVLSVDGQEETRKTVFVGR